METDQNRADEAEKSIRKYMWGAVAAGIVPVPVLDIALVTGIQLQMVRSLAWIYDVPFSEQLGTSVIGALVGGSLPMTSSGLLKLVPGVGSLLGLVGAPLVAGASTYAVGRVFIQHFESGGTFLTFDPQKVREYYAQQFATAKEEITRNYTGIKP